MPENKNVVQEGEFKEVVEKKTRKRKPKTEVVEAVEAPTPEEGDQINVKFGIIIGVTEEGNLFHKYIGSEEGTLTETEGLLAYVRRVVDKRWDEVL